MSIAFDPARLAYEMAIRGLSGTDVARKAVLSPATVSTALAGKPIAEASALLIVKALDATPVVEILVRLVAPIVQPSKDDPPPEPAPGQA
jgi:lambda repressor-like predicted transcriptional regulator